MSHRTWERDGVRVVPGDRLDTGTPANARNSVRRRLRSRARARRSCGPGPCRCELESIIDVVRGRARMRWGNALEYVAEAGPGDFIFVPPYVPHQEINASDDDELACVVVRSGQDPVVINLDIASAEEPHHVRWSDTLHP